MDWAAASSLTRQKENDINNTLGGDDHHAQKYPRPKWPRSLGIDVRDPSESLAEIIGMRRHDP